MPVAITQERSSTLPPVISVVLCTWNRAALLEGALETLVGQQGAPTHEILVVDNRSTDDTHSVVERYARKYSWVRYLFEGSPGLSYARNTGIAHTSGALVAFTDDDVRVPADWLRLVEQVGQQHADAAFFGGPVLPDWPSTPPAWITENEWSALGVQTHGEQLLRTDLTRPLCLIGANLIVRRRVLETIGPFAPEVQRVGEGIGSTEDHEHQRRIWAAGAHGVYEPRLRVRAVIAPERLTKRYHRRWHFGHGRHIARMRMPEMEASRLHVAGVPVHLLRQMSLDAGRTLRSRLGGDATRAFQRELQVWFAAGFIRERLTQVHMSEHT